MIVGYWADALKMLFFGAVGLFLGFGVVILLFFLCAEFVKNAQK